MENSNKAHQKEAKDSTVGRATEKEETTNDSHKVNKGPDAQKAEGHDEKGRCTSTANDDQAHEDNG